MHLALGSFGGYDLSASTTPDILLFGPGRGHGNQGKMIKKEKEKTFGGWLEMISGTSL